MASSSVVAEVNFSVLTVRPYSESLCSQVLLPPLHMGAWNQVDPHKQGLLQRERTSLSPKTSAVSPCWGLLGTRRRFRHAAVAGRGYQKKVTPLLTACSAAVCSAEKGLRLKESGGAIMCVCAH